MAVFAGELFQIAYAIHIDCCGLCTKAITGRRRTHLYNARWPHSAWGGLSSDCNSFVTWVIRAPLLLRFRDSGNCVCLPLGSTYADALRHRIDH
jgi:hypothetical protein